MCRVSLSLLTLCARMLPTKTLSHTLSRMRSPTTTRLFLLPSAFLLSFSSSFVHSSVRCYASAAAASCGAETATTKTAAVAATTTSQPDQTTTPTQSSVRIELCNGAVARSVVSRRAQSCLSALKNTLNKRARFSRDF